MQPITQAQIEKLWQAAQVMLANNSNLSDTSSFRLREALDPFLKVNDARSRGEKIPTAVDVCEALVHAIDQYNEDDDTLSDYVLHPCGRPQSIEEMARDILAAERQDSAVLDTFRQQVFKAIEDVIVASPHLADACTDILKNLAGNTKKS